MAETYHIPALLPEALEALAIRPDGIYVDVTLGGGGHSSAILERLGSDGRLISFDQDSDAIERVMEGTLGRDSRFTPVHANFRFLSNFMRYHGVDGHVDGLLGDLGVSFHHFDDASRGFSFRFDAPLDMRMNRLAPRSAADLLAEVDARELADAFTLYGELRQGRRLADAIVKARASAPVDTVGRLTEVVTPLLNPRQLKKEMAQLFQALRIVVNDEMGALKALLRQSLRALRPGGRLVIITYHSLEDRLVKNFMKTGNVEGRLEQDFYGRSLAPLKMLTSRPIVASEAEVEANPRSRSAKMRVAVKLETESDNG